MNENSKQKPHQDVQMTPGPDQFHFGPLPGSQDRLLFSSDSGVSRESSFSSCDRLSTDDSRKNSFSSRSSGSSSSVSRSCSWRSVDETDPANAQGPSLRRTQTADQRSYLRMGRFSLGSRNGENFPSNKKGANYWSSSDVFVKRPSIDDHGRSISESVITSSKSYLRSPEGLLITTPYRLIHADTNYKRSDNKEMRRSGIRSADSSPRASIHLDNGAWMKNCLQILEQSIQKESKTKDDLLRQKIEELQKQVKELCYQNEELVRDRNRITCERDALRIEHDLLRDEKEELQRELENKKKVIQHIQEHLKNTAPVLYHDQTKSQSEHSRPKFRARTRSKSEVQPPVFFIPEHATSGDSYTCI